MTFKAITIMNDTDLGVMRNYQDGVAFDVSSRRDEDSSGGDDHDWCANSGSSLSGGITTISNVIDGQCCHHSKSLFEVVDVYDVHGSASLQSNDDSNVDSFDSYFKMQKDGPMVPGTDIPQSRLSMYQDSAGDELESRPPDHDDWDSEREGGSSLSSITNEFFTRNLTAATSAIGGWTRRHAIGPPPTKIARLTRDLERHSAWEAPPDEGCIGFPLELSMAAISMHLARHLRRELPRPKLE